MTPNEYKARRFDDYTALWFDDLASYYLPEETRQEFDHVLQQVPNRRAVEKLRNVAVSNKAFDALVEHIDAVLDKEFRMKGEFRLSFSTTCGDLSAARNLFNTIHQAINYEKE